MRIAVPLRLNRKTENILTKYLLPENKISRIELLDREDLHISQLVLAKLRRAIGYSRNLDTWDETLRECIISKPTIKDYDTLCARVNKRLYFRKLKKDETRKELAEKVAKTERERSLRRYYDKREILVQERKEKRLSKYTDRRDFSLKDSNEAFLTFDKFNKANFVITRGLIRTFGTLLEELYVVKETHANGELHSHVYFKLSKPTEISAKAISFHCRHMIHLRSVYDRDGLLGNKTKKKKGYMNKQNKAIKISLSRWKRRLKKELDTIGNNLK